MALYYQAQDLIPVLGSKVTAGGVTAQTDPSFVTTGATLTATYAGNISGAKNIRGMSQANFNVKYVAGTNATELDLKFEFTGDNAVWQAPVNWYQETSEAVAVGVTNEYLQTRKFSNNGSLVGGTTYSFRITMPVADYLLRVSAQEILSSGSGFGTVYIEMIGGGR